MQNTLQHNPIGQQVEIYAPPISWKKIVQSPNYDANIKKVAFSTRCAYAHPDYLILLAARNEQRHIISCLKSLRRAMNKSTAKGRILLLVNNTTDATYEKSLEFSQQASLPLDAIDINFPPKKASAGRARALIFELAELFSRPNTLLITTDADSCVAEGFITAHLYGTRCGVSLLCGRVLLPEEESEKLPAKLRIDGIWEDRYLTLSQLARQLIDPDPLINCVEHGQESGANMSLTAKTVQIIGGIPSCDSGEDRAVVRAALERDLKISYSDKPVVFTSARLEGRARGGMAETLKQRLLNDNYSCDTRLENATRTILRSFARQQLRKIWHNPEKRKTYFLQFGLSPSAIKRTENFYTFHALWHYLEQASSTLYYQPLPHKQLKEQYNMLQRFISLYVSSTYKDQRTPFKNLTPPGLVESTAHVLVP